MVSQQLLTQSFRVRFSPNYRSAVPLTEFRSPKIRRDEDFNQALLHELYRNGIFLLKIDYSRIAVFPSSLIGVVAPALENGGRTQLPTSLSQVLDLFHSTKESFFQSHLRTTRKGILNLEILLVLFWCQSNILVLFFGLRVQLPASSKIDSFHVSRQN